MQQPSDRVKAACGGDENGTQPKSETTAAPAPDSLESRAVFIEGNISVSLQRLEALASLDGLNEFRVLQSGLLERLKRLQAGAEDLRQFLRYHRL